jgi:hypothetical protein
MGAPTIGRRDVLRGAGVAAAGAAVGGLGLASPALASEDKGHGLLGSWMITRQDTGDPTKVMAVVSFAAGNVIVVHDIQPAGPPFSGTWASRGERFRATFWSGQAGMGPDSPGPSIRVRITDGHVERGAISGTYTVAVFDPTGAESPGGTGSFTGKPITA